MLAVFMAGAVFAWDDWFVEQTRDAQLQQVVDTVFNSTFFILFGAAIPWAAFQTIGVMRLCLLTVLLLIFRRLPFVFVLTNLFPKASKLKTGQERIFAGWFGPIGVGAIFYATLASMEWPNTQFTPITCFVVMSSVIAHGITVPLFHLSMTRQLTLPITYLRAELWELSTAFEGTAEAPK